METIVVGIREAKQHLSKLLKRVQQGEAVLVKDRGRPVARIVPIDTAELSLTERIKRLEVQGVIEPLAEKQRKVLPSPIPVPEAMAQRFLQEDRENGG
ncbi:MAG: type II toxin-antitoxin system prevent-host-death family antitoxin [Pseudomonadota bacterium]